MRKSDVFHRFLTIFRPFLTDFRHFLSDFDDFKTKDKAFTLIICLLIALGVIYITDTVVSALGFTPSTLGATLIDGFKLFISSLIGYVFAEKHRQDK